VYSAQNGQPGNYGRYDTRDMEKRLIACLDEIERELLRAFEEASR
jgi:hypothetical protein